MALFWRNSLVGPGLGIYAFVNLLSMPEPDFRWLLRNWMSGLEYKIFSWRGLELSALFRCAPGSLVLILS